MVICIKWFLLIKTIHIRCFLTLKFVKNISEFELIFGFELILFFGWCFSFFKSWIGLSWFLKFLKVFWVKNRLKNKFFSKKILGLNFPAITMVEIRAWSDDTSSKFFKEKTVIHHKWGPSHARLAKPAWSFFIFFLIFFSINSSSYIFF
jgi:hypothetical protein